MSKSKEKAKIGRNLRAMDESLGPRWHTQDGRDLLPADMEDRHVTNTINLIRRGVRALLDELGEPGSRPLTPEETAVLHGACLMDSEVYGGLCEEAARRGLRPLPDGGRPPRYSGPPPGGAWDWPEALDAAIDDVARGR